MKLCEQLSNFGQLEFIILVLVAVVVFRANTIAPEAAYSAEAAAKNSFENYNDSLISLNRLGAMAESELRKSDVGTPIRLMGTNSWIVPMGTWSMHITSSSVQGKAIKSVNPLKNIPYRAVRTILQGPFEGMIRYDQMTNDYQWVLSNDKIDSIVYLRSKSLHLVEMESSRSRVILKEVLNNVNLEYFSQGEILSWCTLPTSDSLYVTERIDDKMVLKQIPLISPQETTN